MAQGKGGLLVVLTTTESREDAERLARSLVEERLAACAQVSGPMTSWYWWEGRLESAEEWLLRLKTSTAAYPRLEARLVELHPYSVPQVVALPVEAAYGGYEEWALEQVVA